MSRVTGLSVVDNQYVFVRGLGERYSNTTLAGSVLPTTEPDKKVVPLDLFPAGLIDSVQVSKSYSPDRSAEFAGGLVQIVPLKFPSRPVFDFSLRPQLLLERDRQEHSAEPARTAATGFGFDDGARALPAGIPDNKIVRQGIYTPDVGYTPEQITAFGRLLDNQWRRRPTRRRAGTELGRGVRQPVRQARRGRQRDALLQGAVRRGAARASSASATARANSKRSATTHAVPARRRRSSASSANIAYQFTTNHRLAFENFYSHSGRDEGRTSRAPNTENGFYYRNNRLQFIEEGLMSNAVAGEHFLRGARNSRIDWRVNFARANRDEPDLRETLYQQPFLAGTRVRT